MKIKRIVEGYPCAEGMSIFKFDFILNYKLWPIIQKYYNGKPTLASWNLLPFPNYLNPALLDPNMPAQKKMLL